MGIRERLKKLNEKDAKELGSPVNPLPSGPVKKGKAKPILPGDVIPLPKKGEVKTIPAAESPKPKIEKPPKDPRNAELIRFRCGHDVQAGQFLGSECPGCIKGAKLARKAKLNQPREDDLTGRLPAGCTWQMWCVDVREGKTVRWGGRLNVPLGDVPGQALSYGQIIDLKHWKSFTAEHPCLRSLPVVIDRQYREWEANGRPMP